MSNTKEDVARVWAALRKLGINSEAEFRAAQKKQKPINIACMVSPRPSTDVIVK